MKIATITANYNNGKHIKDCLDGIANQSEKPNVIFIVDDGSTDDSKEQIINLCGLYETVLSSPVEYSLNQGGYKGITVLSAFLPENKGPSFARNVALKHLINNVDFIAIADADDIYYRNKIRSSVEIMLQYPHIAAVYSDYSVRNMATGALSYEYKEPYSYARLAEECIVSNNSVIASNIFKIIGGYDESIRSGEDYDLWLRIADHACLYHIPESLYEYRITGQNATVTTPKDQFAADVMKVKQKAAARRGGML